MTFCLEKYFYNFFLHYKIINNKTKKICIQTFSDTKSVDWLDICLNAMCGFWLDIYLNAMCIFYLIQQLCCFP